MVKKTKEQIQIEDLIRSVYCYLTWIGIYLGTLLMTFIVCLIFKSQEFKEYFFILSACMFVSNLGMLIINLIKLVNKT